MSALRHLPLLFLLAAACGTISEAGDSTGSYTATVTGAVSANYTGEMVHRPGGITEGYEYAVSMRIPDAPPPLGIFLFFSGRPRAGTYRVIPWRGDQPRSGEVLASFNPQNFEGYLAGSGEVRITSSRPLRGTFEFTASRAASESVRVSGSFDSR
jgi:hypothetical protein